MKSTLAICRRDMGSYFNSPVAYIVITVFLLFVGVLFFVPFFSMGKASARELFGVIPFLYIFFVPAITMRLIAEEKHTGTIEVLSTMPVRDGEVIIGKFLAALGLLAVALLLTIPYPIAISTMGKLDWGPVLGGYIGLILMGSSYLSIGILASSVTKNQIVAFVIALFLSMAFMLLDRFLYFLPSALSSILEYFSLSYHFRNISRGVVDSRDVLFFVSFTATGLLLSLYALQSRRWR